jgi:hypothetical protein
VSRVKHARGDGWIPRILRGRRCPGAGEATRIGNHLPATLRSGHLGPTCFTGFALFPDRPCNACQLCDGRRDRDDDELAIDA